MPNPSRAARLNQALEKIRTAGPDGAQIVETTPMFGGLRKRDVDILVARGLVEWHGSKARLVTLTEEESSECP